MTGWLLLPVGMWAGFRCGRWLEREKERLNQQVAVMLGNWDDMLEHLGDAA